MVLIAIGAICAPLVIALSSVSPSQAAITALGVLTATVSGRRDPALALRRPAAVVPSPPDSSSRVATFAEAFKPIGWAATSALALTISALPLLSAAR